MSSPTFAVIVEPHRWQRSPEELARLLEPLTGVSSTILVTLLQRGPVTVEADLSLLGAQNLLSRLQGLGIPAAIQGDAEPTRQVAPPPPSFEATSESEPEEDVARTISGRPTSAEPTIQLGMAASAPSPTSPQAGWGSLFPDLDTPTPVLPTNAKNAKTNPLPVSLFEDDHDLNAPDLAPAPPAAVPTANLLTTPVSVKQAPEQQPTPSLSEAPKPIAEAFRRTEERAPYAPTGYDDRDPHLPLLARFLSAIAPGAGQIYNGDDDLALDYGLKFFLLKPWWAAVRHAGRRAERIRDFWLPWPKPGALLRALRYAAGFWFVNLSIVGIVAFIVNTALERRIPEDPGITDADRASAQRDANARVVAARIAALDALAEAAQEQRVSEYTMSDTERAARIFRVAYGYCVQKDYFRCEALMKRAYTLNRAESRALRLQAWASVQARTPDGSQMPDVGPVESLSEFELEQFRKEQNEQQETP